MLSGSATWHCYLILLAGSTNWLCQLVLLPGSTTWFGFLGPLLCFKTHVHFLVLLSRSTIMNYSRHLLPVSSSWLFPCSTNWLCHLVLQTDLGISWFSLDFCSCHPKDTHYRSHPFFICSCNPTDTHCRSHPYFISFLRCSNRHSLQKSSVLHLQ